MAKTNCVYKFNTAAGPVEIRGMAAMKAFLVANGVEAITGAGTKASGRQTETAAFKRWFGDSKVVDEQGRPLAVYHGTFVGTLRDGKTVKGDIEAFDRMFTTRFRKPSIDTVGSWFSTNPGEGGALMYAGGGRVEGGAIYPVYLSIKNPHQTTFALMLRRARLLANGKDDGRMIGEAEVNAYRKWLNEMGKDGVKIVHDEGAPNQSTEFKNQDVWIALEPTQIKSAIGNAGTFDPTNPDIRFSKRQPEFVSQLATAIEGVPPKLATQPAKQWALWLDSNAAKLGVKKDEIEWSGIKDYLALRGAEKVTKADLGAYLAANGVQVEETVLGEAEPITRYVVRDERGRELASFDNEDDADQYASDRYIENNNRGRFRIEAIEEENFDAQGVAKFDDYTLPGGENYREVLLTLPQSKTGRFTIRITSLGARSDGSRSFASRQEAEDWLSGLIASGNGFAKDAEVVEEREGKTYQSSHWDQPNVIAHLRVNDRTDADGAKVLFVEEVQSDWGQEGKKKGFAFGITEADREAAKKKFGYSDEYWAAASIEEKNDLVEVMRGREFGGVVPPAPFVTKTEGWLNLALKRVAMMAVEGGYDKVAFVNGEQSADRYDLSKKVGFVSLDKTYEGFVVTAYRNDDATDEVLQKTVGTEQEVADIIGKDATENLLKDMGKGTHGELRRADLKVGGEGMKTFYDKLVPQALNKLLPKLGGGKLGEVTIVLNENLRAQVAPADAGTAEDDGRGFWLGSKGKAWENQPGFDVTDKMRETVEAGVPLFSKRQGDMVGQNFTVPATSKIDAARIVLQDDALRMKRVIEAVKAKGGVVGEQQNFYDALTLMPGRMQSAVEDFKNDVVKPMLKQAAEYDIDLDELALYAYAKHAKERNAYIAGINKRFPDGGSGMKNAEADKVLADIRAGGKQRQYDDLHKRLMDIASTTRNLMLSEGLITQEEFDAMENAYSDYIPLRGFENVDEETGAIRPGIGRGVNIRGGETIRALGRSSRAGDLIENVIRDYERVITRVEKNDVGKVLLDFVLSNPDPDLWGVDIERSKPTFNKAKGVVQYTKQVEKGEDTIGVKVGGQQVYIKLADRELTRALRQAWKDETSGLERATLLVTGWWNNWMRAVLTKYNPAFAILNIPRDALWSGAASALDALGPKGLKNYTMHYFRAFAASARHETGLSGSTNSIFGNPVLDREFNQFRAAGGITGGFSMRTLQDINQDLRNELLLAGASPRTLWERVKSLPPFKLAKLTLRVLEFMGAASENATRFALYQAARETGKTVSDAAILAKDGTTNFNRKGEWGGALNNLYLFFNASVQGSAQLLKVLKNRNVQASMAGVAGVGMMLALYGASAGGEDDDGEAYWDKIPGYIKERNIVIMLPPGEALAGGIERVGKRGRYLTIPVQYGFNIFPNIGYMVADVLRNQADPKRGMTPTKAALHMASVVFGSVNPLGGAVDLSDGVQVLLAAMPTLADLPIQIITERGTFGTPSAPQPTPSDKKPDSERMFASQQGSASASIAKTLNELGGGNEGKAGSVLGVETSVTPGTIQTLISATTGGLGTFMEQMLTAVNFMAGGEEDLKSNKIPFINKFYGEVDESANIRGAAERMENIRKLSNEVKAQQRVGINPELKDDEQKLIALANMQERYQELQARMRKAELEIIKDTEMTEAQKRLERRQIQVDRDKLATEMNREYLKEVGR